jgi:ABC-type branched-subunit amino acid transport system ATPase component
MLQALGQLCLSADDRDIFEGREVHALEPTARRALGIAYCILSFVRGHAEAQPLLLIDEPSGGVQWENILQMAALIEEAKAAGRAVVVVEQNLAFAERLADRYVVLDQGRAVLEGRADEIAREQLLAHLHV